MNIIIWLATGGLVGWVASQAASNEWRQGLLLNVLIGMAGAVLGGWTLGPLFATSTIDQGDFSLIGVSVPLLGAAILLIVVHLVRRSAAR